MFFFFFSSRRRHTRLTCDWSPDVCSSDLVVVGAVMDALKLVPPERERELDVRRRGRVVGALVVRVVAEAHLLFRDALLDVPRQTRLLPLVVEARGIGGSGEVLHLHLLELARAED